MAGTTDPTGAAPEPAPSPEPADATRGRPRRWAVALGRLPPVFSSLVIFLEAVAAAIFGWILLGEALTLVQALGGALILFGIWTARPRPQAPVG